MADDKDPIQPQTLDEILQTPSDRPVNKPAGRIPVPVGVGRGFGKAIKEMYQSDIEKDLEHPNDD